jgi:hypothetical protein
MLEIQTSVFVPRQGGCGCNHHEEALYETKEEAEHECCGGNCHCGELVEVDDLISELAELALAKNYANVEDFAHYIAQEMINRVRHNSQFMT